MIIYNGETNGVFEAVLIFPPTGEEISTPLELAETYYQVPVKFTNINDNWLYNCYCETIGDEEKVKKVFAAAQFWLDCKQFMRQQLNRYNISERRTGLLGEKIIANLEEVYTEHPPKLEQVIDYMKDIEYQTTVCKNGELIFTSYEWLRENITGFDI